jgi:hypothetical protein
MSPLRIAVFCVSVLIGIVALTAVSATSAPQQTDPTNLLAAVFGANAEPRIGKVMILRENPWIARVIGLSPHLFDEGTAGAGDSSATMTDSAGIDALENAMRATTVSKGCYKTKFTARDLPVSWAIFFYRDRFRNASKIASLYLTLDGMCATEGKNLYFVDPQGISLYLKRNFSFMNF